MLYAKLPVWAEMQIEGLDDVQKWLWDCVEGDNVTGCYVVPFGTYGTAKIRLASQEEINKGTGEEVAPLGRHYSTQTLRDAFFRHTKASHYKWKDTTISKILKKLGFLRKIGDKNSIGGVGKWGYTVPDKKTLKNSIIKANRMEHIKHDEEC
jgi:hypothetical protein